MNSNIQIENDEQIKDKSKTSAAFFQQLEKWNNFLDYTYALPMEILEKGVDNIYNLVTNHTIACSCCLCVTISLTISVATIAIGLGVGLGIGCQQIKNIYTNSTNG